jgi:hypothetical protein
MGSQSLVEISGSGAPLLEIEYPLPPEYGFCVVLHGFLSAGECRTLIDAAEAQGFRAAASDYPPSYRDNDRLVADDPARANWLFERLCRFMAMRDESAPIRRQEEWRLSGVNERIRLCRYRAGTRFGIHQDGVHHRGANVRSRLTFMVYLNSGEFDGGDTVFYRGGPLVDEASGLRFQPRTGSLIMFDHGLWHAGAVVDSGTKYILRSDLLYERASEVQQSGPFEPAHHGYVWALARLSDGRIASAGRDASIRLWNDSGEPCASFSGHAQSILAITESRPGELVSVSRDRSIQRWSITTSSSSVIGMMDSAVLSLARLDEDLVVTGDADGVLAWWHRGLGESVRRRAHAGWIWALSSICPDRFVSASEDGSVKLWSRDGSAVATVFRGKRPLRCVDSAANFGDSVRLAIGDADGVIHLLTIAGARTRSLEIQAHRGAVRKVRYSTDQTLLSVGEDGRVCRWDLRTLRGVTLAQHDNFATDVIDLGDGTTISAGYDGRIRKHVAPSSDPTPARRRIRPAGIR